MTDAPKPPKRRRRKLIAAFGVLVSLVVLWWYWPRGDARFVGKWKMMTVGEDSVPASTVGWLVLKANGSAFIELSESRPSESAAWSVSESRLALGPPASLIRPLWVTSLIQWVVGSVGVPLKTGAMVFEITEIRSNQISIHDLDFGSDLILTRVSE